MTLLLLFFIILISILHFGFLILEMFLWDKPIGLKIFRQSKDQASASKTLAINMGLYNGFLGAGLIWGIVTGQSSVSIFFLSCVLIAGIVGGLTVSKRVFIIQGIPAIIALLLILFT